MTKTKPSMRVRAKFLAFIIFFLITYSNYSQGPTSPEAASFESLDATDMVNLVTGDFTYVLPLIEIPGPEGGYPITLSYHAGIAIDQEATWTGLGWNVNPGAINRSISGMPDDWKQANLSSIAHDNGGEINYHNFSVGVGWGDGKYSTGLYGSYVENKAYNGENSYSFDIGAYYCYNGITSRLGSDGIGLSYSNDINKKGVDMSYSVGINHSFKNGATNLNVSADTKMNSTGTDTGSEARTNSSASIGIDISIFGTTRSNHSSGLSFAPMGNDFILNASIYLFNINYSYKKVRYWYFDKKTYPIVGALYPGNISNIRSEEIFEDIPGYDVYNSFYDYSKESASLENNMSYVSYDNYSVSAQGIGGSISPKIFKYGSLTPAYKKINYDSNVYSLSSYIKDDFSEEIGTTNSNIYFYFDNMYESYLRVTANNWGGIPSNINKITDIPSPNSVKVTSTNINGINYSNYNSITKRKGGSSYVESYTNLQIRQNPSLVYESESFNRNNPTIPENGIGAFKITTSDGKTYHYTIPVYQKEKFARSSQYNEDIENKFYEEFQLKPYATHWLLTAITGSDFVDNGDGIIEEGDLGYWVTFNYGKWSDGYTWRTPSGSDYKTTITSKMYEWGVKELYYLNTIKSRTHTALFIKSLRNDSKSLSRTLNKEYTSVVDAHHRARPKNNIHYFTGFQVDLPPQDNIYNLFALRINHKVKLNYNCSPHSTLKLDKIILLRNENIPSDLKFYNSTEPIPNNKFTLNIQERIALYHNSYYEEFPENGYKTTHNVSRKGEYYNNILDKNDIEILTPNIENLALKVINFKYSYELAQNSPNSNDINKGRLTLKQVDIGGKKGTQLIPPYRFEYDNPGKLYNYTQVDDWGYISNDPASWNLNRIISPNGGEIIVDYESDDFHKEAVSYSTILNKGLKFTFSEVNNKLRIKAENLLQNNPHNYDFTKLFTQNGTATVDIWACVDHEYLSGLIPTCHNRSGSVDIPDQTVNVISVNNNSVIFETSLNYTSESNGGLGWLYTSSNGPSSWSYDMGSRFQDKARGECPDQEGNCDNTRYAFKYRLESNASLKDAKGGGLRVKKITIKGDGKNYETNYYYNQDGYAKNRFDTNYKSSGVTTYAPSGYDKSIKYITELPPPTVLYHTVTVDRNNEKTKYYFKTLDTETETGNDYMLDDILQVKKIQSEDNLPLNISNDWDVNTVSKHRYEITQNFSALGGLLRKQKFNNKEQLISENQNIYKSLSEVKQGINQETFNTYSTLDSKINGLFNRIHHLNVTSKIIYPSVLDRSIIKENNFVSTTYFDNYDFNTGHVLESRTTNSKGQEIKTEIIPAYKRYPGMGSKVDDPTNKNMLTQEAATYSYLKDNNTWKITGVGISTWKYNWENTSSAWRKHKTFTWNGQKDENGFFTNYTKTETDDDDFNWADSSVKDHGEWKLLGETTKYNNFSAPLEFDDINGNRASTKYDSKHEKILATANAPYNAMFYSGAEDLLSSNFGGGVYKGTGSILDPLAHTGQNSLLVSSGQQAFRVIPGVSGKYKISVWVHEANYTHTRLNNSITDVQYNPDEIITAGDWKQLNFYTDVTATNAVYLKTNGSQIRLDDFRMHPVSSGMTSYVYNQWDELECIINANNMATKYEYDKAGRLKTVYVEKPNKGFIKIEEYDQHYKF